MLNKNRRMFSKNLKHYMSEKGVSRAEFCDSLGFKYSTVSEWLSGHKYPRIDKIEKIADYFGIHKSDLIENPVLSNARPLPSVHTCKYFHSVSAGIGMCVDNDCDTYSYFFKSQAQADHCFAVDIRGDSMVPELHSGDVAIVDTASEPQDDDIVVFYDKSTNLGYIKQYRRLDNCVMFIPRNSAYTPMVFSMSDFSERIVILGKVIAINRHY